MIGLLIKLNKQSVYKVVTKTSGLARVRPYAMWHIGTNDIQHFMLYNRSCGTNDI